MNIIQKFIKKEKAMIRILQVVNVMDRAGLETVLMNYYRNVDRLKIQFDFLTHRDDIGAYEEEIKKMGGKIYHAPRLYPQNYVKYFRFMKKFFEEYPEYKVIHSHIDSMSFFPLFTAQKSNVPVRVGHSHSSKLDRDLKFPIKFIALKLMPFVANNYFACGELAGKFMYPNREFTVLHNAIDLEKFEFNDRIRNQVRKKLGLEHMFIVGHVGRYCYIKNQIFLLDVFSQILKKKENSVLVLVGKGEDENKIREKAKKLGIFEKVLLLIDRADVNEIYQIFDIFIMPSLFEGVPVVGIEAQANGLSCIFSDHISNEILLTSNSSLMPLNASVDDWANRVLSIDIERNKLARIELKDRGYDIKAEAKKLQDWYIEKYQNAKGIN